MIEADPKGERQKSFSVLWAPRPGLCSGVQQLVCRGGVAVRHVSREEVRQLLDELRATDVTPHEPAQDLKVAGGIDPLAPADVERSFLAPQFISTTPTEASPMP